MKERANAAVPRWDPDRERWILQPYINGKRKTFTSGKPGKAGANEVKRKANRALADMGSGDPTIREVFDDYLKDIDERKGPGSNSRRSAEQIGRVNILPKIGGKKASAVTDQDLQRILNTAKPSGRYSGMKELSRKTVSNIRGEINLLMKFLFKCGYIDRMPAELEIPERLQTKEKNILQREDVRRMLNDESECPYLFAWQMMLIYGLRPGEAYGLQWADVDGDKLTVKRSINHRKEITPGKNRNARRVEMLIPIAKDVIERSRSLQKKQHVITKWMFAGPDGRHINPQNSSDKLHTYCAANGLPDVTPYRLRHTFVTLLRATLTEGQMRMIVGHSASMDTFGIYGGILDDEHIQTGGRLSEFYDQLLS